MSDTDAVLSAVRAVEDGGESPTDGTEGPSGLQESPDRDEEIGAVLSEEPEAESGVVDVDLSEWALSVPEGSHRDFDARDWWDPEGGGENRLAYHLSDLAGSGAGYPNLPGAIVGVVELYYRRVVGVEASDDGSDGAPQVSGDGPQETASRKEADSYV